MNRENSAASIRARSPRPEAMPGMVLVVDDEPLMLRALGRILREDGHQLVLAESPEGASAGDVAPVGEETP